MQPTSMKTIVPKPKLILSGAWFCICVLVICEFVAWLVVPLFGSSETSCHPVDMDLKHPMTVLDYPSKAAGTAAIILFASGDGGWNDFEQDIAHTLQDRGYTVVGIDSVSYAATDYDLPTLQADFTKIAQTEEARYGPHPPPLIVGGYSMGAAQAIAVAGGPHPPPDLKGLLLVDPCSRGRYGLRTSDQMNVLPTGDGTFSMDDFSRTMGDIRVVQWHAGNDSIDSRAWLTSLVAPHKEFDFPGAGHDYNHDRSNFLHQFADSVGWILGSKDGAVATNKKTEQ